MLIQKTLEAKIVEKLTAALSAASVTSCNIEGAWQTASSGLVKWIENADNTAFLSVAVGTPGWATFSTPVVDFSVTLALFVRTELDAQGTALAAVAEVIEDKLRAWQTATYQQTFTDLDVTGLSVDGINISAGSSPTVQDGLCAVRWTFTLSGSYAGTSN